jgi:uncharacterized protein with PQ loop repeat
MLPSVGGMDLHVAAGVVSTVIFALSMMPMMVKAARTKNLESYSLGHIVLTNAGNAVHSVYVFSLPVGPIWALHGFYLVTAGTMLVWCLRYGTAVPGTEQVGTARPSVTEALVHAGQRDASSGATSETSSTRWMESSMSRSRANASSSGHTGRTSVQCFRPTRIIAATEELSA